jgi:hypothetical protein
MRSLVVVHVQICTYSYLVRRMVFSYHLHQWARCRVVTL